jgi:hypothetical protein
MTKLYLLNTTDETLYDALKEALIKLGHSFFDNGDYNLNLIGIRSGARQAGLFDDILCCAYREKGVKKVKRYEATTDAGTYWYKNPMNAKGTAMMVPGQYKGAYKIGKHTGYLALVQSKPIKVYRDNNRDIILDVDSATIEEGMFAVNIHRASAITKSKLNTNWSAGCQVVSSPSDFKELMGLARKSESLYGNSFTYTLVEENWI